MVVFILGRRRSPPPTLQILQISCVGIQRVNEKFTRFLFLFQILDPTSKHVDYSLSDTQAHKVYVFLNFDRIKGCRISSVMLQQWAIYNFKSLTLGLANGVFTYFGIWELLTNVYVTILTKNVLNILFFSMLLEEINIYADLSVTKLYLSNTVDTFGTRAHINLRRIARFRSYLVKTLK